MPNSVTNVASEAIAIPTKLIGCTGNFSGEISKIVLEVKII